MKNLLFIFCYLMFSFLPLTHGFAHSVKMGVFELRQSGEYYSFQVRLDREDLLNVIMADPSNYSNVDAAICRYVQQHLKMLINRRQTMWQFDRVTYDENNITVFSKRVFISEPLYSVEVTNTCLLQQVPDQLNMFTVEANDNKRYFKMSADRPLIKVDYPS